jgi:glutamate-ammonia-ligase adenylyltransferase
MTERPSSLIAASLSPFYARTMASLALKGSKGQHSLQRLDALVRQPVQRSTIEACFEALSGEPGISLRLRRLRELVLLALIERDVNGIASLQEVCEAMTDLAELACQQALASVRNELIERHGAVRDRDGQLQDLLVVAMGKAGGRELNVSSDLDLVFVFRDQGISDGAGSEASRLDASQWMIKAARRLLQILSDPSEGGFVFRVDTRLRPNGDSGPLVASLPMLETYFYSQGREWERFAWLKARVIASTGLQADGVGPDERTLDQIVTPFVFRRYLDFEAVGAMRDLHALIRTEVHRKDSRAQGSFDVKLGRGGIREIEFIAQLFQIIRAGRDLGLRSKSTLTTLEGLGQRGHLASDQVVALKQGYSFLRRVEHALQYREDEQTHRLPSSPEARAPVARMLGMNQAEFESTLQHTTSMVQTVFDGLLQAPQYPVSSPASESASRASTDAVVLPPEAASRLQGLRESGRVRSAKADSQQAIERIIRAAAGSAQVHSNPATLVRLMDLLETVSGRGAYLALLAQYPNALSRVLRMLGKASWAAWYLQRHPVVLDELLDGQLLEPVEFSRWQAELALQVRTTRLRDGSPDLERQMDVVREAHHAQVFRLLAQDLEGRLSVESLSDALSALADAVLQVSLDAVWSQLRLKFRESPQFAVIAYGKLGGKELGYASDLDLVFLFDDEDDRAAQAYAQLAQRLSGWLSTTTAAGSLFEIDLRLRPNGNAGLLVSSVKAFARYQRESAWVWEHQALTRARFCAGDPQVGRQFEALRHEIIAQPRDHASLRNEVQTMRKKMHDGHPNRTELFDIKHDEGGMVDVEFAVQYLVLAHAHRVVALKENLGNIALLNIAAAEGLLRPEIAKGAADAYRELRRLQHACRLNGDAFARLAPERCETLRQAVRALTQAWTISG